MKSFLLLLVVLPLAACTSPVKEPQRDVAGKTTRQRKVGRILAPPIFLESKTRQTTVPSLVGRIDFFYEANKADSAYTFFLDEKDPAAASLKAEGAPRSWERPNSFSLVVPEKDIEFLKPTPCSATRNVCIGDFIAKDSSSAENYSFSKKKLKDPPPDGIYEVWFIVMDKSQRSFVLTTQGFVAEEDLQGHYKLQACMVLERNNEVLYRCRR